MLASGIIIGVGSWLFGKNCGMGGLDLLVGVVSVVVLVVVSCSWVIVIHY